MSRRILVTGGAGFIGSHLVDLLVDQGEHVWVIDALTYAGNLRNLSGVMGSSQFRFIEGDIRNLELIDQIFTDLRPEIVFHLAAETHVDRSIIQPNDFLENNLMGTWALLQRALAYWKNSQGIEQSRFRFIQVSSDEVFGSIEAPDRFHEGSPYRPSSPYSASKAGADHLLQSFHTTFGFPGIISLCSNNFGPRQFPEKLIPMVVQRVLDGESIPIYGAGENVRDWIYVKDHCRALVLLAEKGIVGESYLIGAENEWSNLDLITKIYAETGLILGAGSYEKQFKFVDDRLGHDQRYAVDPGKMFREFGWKAEIFFDEALRTTIQSLITEMSLFSNSTPPAAE